MSADRAGGTLPGNRALQPHGSFLLARALKYLIQLLAVGAAYYVLARFCRELVSIYPGLAAIWLPAGLGLAAVMLAGYRVVPAIFVAAYAANTSIVSLEPDYATAAIA